MISLKFVGGLSVFELCYEVGFRDYTAVRILEADSFSAIRESINHQRKVGRSAIFTYVKRCPEADFRWEDTSENV